MGGQIWPLDLLEFEPALRINGAVTDAAIVFAFAGSASVGLFGDALAQSKIPASSFQPDGFVEDLFLKDFVRSAFPIRVGDRLQSPNVPWLVRLLSHPPVDLRSLELRRGITSELTQKPLLRSALQRVYEHVAQLQALLESGGDRTNPNRRQIEILSTFAEVIELFATEFSTSETALQRLHAFGVRVAESEGFRALRELLAYEGHLATLRLKVDVGSDGRITRLQIEGVTENRDNVFVASPLRRWMSRFELLFRGYRFSEGEVMARLLDAVFEGVRYEFVPLVQLVGDLEFYLGALGFAEGASAAGLAVSLPDFAEPGAPRTVTDLFNPLLLGAGIRPIPCSIALDRHDAILLVTGPNSGGKTRLLQSLALCQLLGQSGLFVPARAATLAITPGLVVSLIQETRADQTEGRLGVELMRIRALFERLPPGAMVVLDELCSGTNPSEGEEIFELVIEMLTLLRPQAFITTHFLAFAARLERERKVESLRFLQVELGPNQDPTYQFRSGVAHTSLAGRAAERLGVTGEQLLGLISKKVAQTAR